MRFFVPGIILLSLLAQGEEEKAGLDWWACQRRAGQWPLNDWHNAYIRFYRQK